MVVVAGIRFQPCGKVYDFEIKDMEINEGDAVIVDSDLGLNIGKVALTKRLDAEPGKPLKPVIRKASEEDIQRQRDNMSSLDEARAFCVERIMARGLPMKLVCADVTLDRKRYIFYFTANTRIDFRELVKDLAAKFKTRIELRQIGVRDEAKLLGGFGICGREVCCRGFLTAFEPVSIRMAKKQDLSLNTAKLSGACGRLMCCLGFEGAVAPSSGSMPPRTREDRTLGEAQDTEQETASETSLSEFPSIKRGEGRVAETASPTPTKETTPAPQATPQGGPEKRPQDNKGFFRRKKKRFRGKKS